MPNYNKSCTVCNESPVIAKGYCNTHYLRNKRHGDPNITGTHSKSKFAPGTIDHFHENTKEVSGPLDTPCLEWQRATTKSGYGVISSKPLQYAHRFSYETFIGPAVDLYVCHQCDNPRCCRPSHLFLGTATDNNSDMVAKGRDRKYTKITNEEVDYIRSKPHNLETQRELAIELGIKANTVYMIQKNLRRQNDIS